MRGLTHFRAKAVDERFQCFRDLTLGVPRVLQHLFELVGKSVANFVDALVLVALDLSFGEHLLELFARAWLFVDDGGELGFRHRAETNLDEYEVLLLDALLELFDDGGAPFCLLVR